MIRPIISSDISILADIDSAVQAYPWTEKMFMDCLHEAYEGFVVLNDEQLCAYLITQTIFDECHILTLGVAKTAQKKGYATQLLQFLMEYKKNYRFLLEVAESNHPAINLYKKFGFQSIGRRKNYYHHALRNCGEDAVVLERKHNLQDNFVGC